MNFKQYLYSKIAEEAAELAQAAIKAQLWGEDSVDPRESTGENNMTKLTKEFIDLHVAITFLDSVLTNEGKMLSEDFDPKEYTKQKKMSILKNWNIVKELANA